MRFITAVFIAAVAMVAAPAVSSADNQISMEAALRLAAQGGSAHSFTHEYTQHTSTETVRTIETHIQIDIKVVQVERTTVEVKESWISTWRAAGKSELDATFKLYVKERDQAKANWFAARRRILEARITIAVHIHRWGSAIHSQYVTDMTSLHNDIVTFNDEVGKFFITLGHGVVKIGEVVLGTLVFAGVEAWHFGGKVVRTGEDAWSAIASDAKNIWISFGLHLELFWNTIKNDVVNTYNNAKNGIDQWETNTSNKFHSAVDGWNHPTVGGPQQCVCPPVDCSHATSAKADSLDGESAAPEHRRQHKEHHGKVHVEVAVN